MLVLLMVYSLLAGCVLVVAAHAGEAMLRSLRLPVRWAWVFSLSVLIVLTLSAPFRSASSLPTSLPSAPVDGMVAAVTTVSDAPHAMSLTERMDRLVNVPLESVGRLLDHPRAGLAATAFAWLWIGGSALLLAGLLVTAARGVRARRSWRPHVVAGMRVRISADAGPAVVGMLRPEIVLPAWLLDRPESEQRMIIAHERAHLDARDPLLLLLSCSALVLLPWNAFAWWLSRRMRLALEIDCDSRVLRGAPSSLSYANILVATAERRSTLRFLSAALADSTSDLERRLDAMNRRSTSYPALRAVAAAGTAALLVLVACEAELPTGAEIDAMSAAEVVEAAAPLASMEGAVYFVDGVATDAATANAIAPDRIATINIRKANGARADASSTVEITTHDAARAIEIAGDKPALDTDHAGFSTVYGRIRVTDAPGGFDGLLLIDGKRVDSNALRNLDPETTETIEVVKGAAAERMYSDPEARNGVITIRLKAAP